MKIMVNHGSAKQREETPHETLADSRTIKEAANDKLETLVELICGAGEESAAALLVLMSMLESAADEKALANTIKHLAFTRCGELNVCGMVDAQIALLDDKLLTSNALPS
jgi:hypothetical protein